jgi:hypothetical protein
MMIIREYDFGIGFENYLLAQYFYIPFFLKGLESVEKEPK